MSELPNGWLLKDVHKCAGRMEKQKMNELPIVERLDGIDRENLSHRDTDSIDAAADLIMDLVAALDNATARARMNDSDGAQISVDNYHLKNGRRLLARVRAVSESEMTIDSGRLEGAEGWIVRERKLINEITRLRAENERLTELVDKYKWQVRDTCTRAEAAERKLARLMEVIDRARPFVAMQLGGKFDHIAKFRLEQIDAALKETGP